MRRYRRLVLMDRAVPFLAAFVGLIALGGAVVVQIGVDQRAGRIAAELAELRGEIAALRERAETPVAAAEPVDDGTVEALLALQDRMNALEAEWAERPIETASTSAAGAGPAGTGGTFSSNADGSPTAVDPDWPTDNCIPLGTRFMASIGDELAICETPVVVHVSAVTADNVMVEGAGVINETSFKPLTGTNCQLMVFTADAEGFAEMRVSCN